MTDKICYHQQSAPLSPVVRPACPWLENPYGLVSLWEVLSFESGRFMVSFMGVRGFADILAPGNVLDTPDNRAQLQGYFNNVSSLSRYCENLGLTASVIQAHKVQVFWDQRLPLDQLHRCVRELLSRVEDELFGTCFYYILPNKAAVLIQEHRLGLEAFPRQMRLKRAYEYFGPEITIRFPQLDMDLREAIKCYAYECLPACVFHLMRATAIGIPKIAKLCGVKDAKPSWGPVLEKAEEFTQRTKFKDLPEDLKPHIEFLRGVVADMRSLQRVWRNKISHVEDKLVPTVAEIDGQDVHEILVATHSFLRHLAEGLPDWC